MGDGAVHDFLTLAKEKLHMFCKAVRRGDGGSWRSQRLAQQKGIVPQPNIGDPGLGDLTLAFLGEAGVVGRADMMRTTRASWVVAIVGRGMG